MRLAPGSVLPERVETAGPERPAWPASCTPARAEDRQPVRVVDGNAVAGVLVTVTEFQTAPPHQPTAREAVIRDCRLWPSLLVAARGDRLKLVNETDYPFLPTMGSGGLMEAVLRGGERQFPLDRPGVFSMECQFTARCGRMDVVVLHHPVFAVTDAHGRFRITNVPANENLKVHAWHPLFRDVTSDVRVAPAATAQRDLVITPQPAPVRPPPIDAGRRGPAENQPGLF